MKKAFDQTVRDIKRGVNKKVLKVPSIEQKVLDATSNEPWGPHGSLLADIAQASRNYHEYQMIMSVIWKRINDTGKNWRHVYKALTILEYLVAHGTERVIDDVREHAYQISTLSDFQYIDSGGRDQGNNIRKKSQSLVVLVNDKERIQEVRQKAAANKDKFRSSPAGGMYRPGSGGYGDRYDDDRYDGRSGSRDDDRNGYGREREWGSRDDDRYGRYGESYGRDGDRYGRDNEEQFGRDGYRDDDYRGRSRSVDKYNYGSRSRSADRDRNPANEEDDQYSSRGSGAKADEHSQDGSGKKQESRYSGQSAPPSYEDALGATDSPAYNERDEESSQSYAPKASSPKDASPSHTTAAAPPPAPVQAAPQHFDQEVSGFDEFDPRGSFSAAPAPAPAPAPATATATATATSNGIAHTTSSLEMDLLGSLAEPFSSNPLALVPANQPHAASEANPSAGFSSGPTAVATSPPPTINSQPFDDPFGDGPFRAITSPDAPNEHQIDTSSNSFTANTSQSLDGLQPVPQKAATEVGGNFYDTPDIPSGPFGMPPTTTTPFTQHESSTPNHEIDILADILPPSAPASFHTQSGYPVPPNQPLPHGGFPPQTNQPAFHPSLNAHQNGFQAQTGQPGFPTQLGNPSLQANYHPQPADSVSHAGFPPQTMALALPPQAGQAPQPGFHAQSGPTPMQQQQQQPSQPHMNFYGAYQPQPASSAPVGGYMVPHSSTGLTSAAPAASQSFAGPVSATQASTGYAVAPKPSSDKFETKSTVWADTLSRGLVNLNISGSKTNPLADIGVDFDAINRREKRMEKQPPTSTAATSTVNMGKAMGSGSGIGRAGAGALRPQPNPMMGPGMNYGMPGGPGRGMGMNMAGMGGYGGSQPIGRGMGMGMGMNMPGSMGMAMNQGPNMQQPIGPPGSTMGYNPSMGGGNYNQQPYGGYR